jgi:hypothetical protein
MSALNGLQRQTAAAKVLLAAFRDAIEDDEQLRTDMVEGETSLIAAAHVCVEDLAYTKGLRAGLKVAMETMKARDQRLEGREQRIRDALVTAMELAGLKKIEAPAGTVSTRPVPPSVIVTDEKEIPPRFFVPVDPKLDKRAVLDALKAGATVPGAELSNGGQTCAVRFT